MKGVITMNKKLNGSAGSGTKILKDITLFSYEYKSTSTLSNNEVVHLFNWKFDGQIGKASIVVDKKNYITDNSMLTGDTIGKPLGLYNDPTLLSVFQVMKKSITQFIYI